MLDSKKLTGPQAGPLKYDIITALAVSGMHGSRGWQTSMTRLISVITARYNWRLDELSLGLREMARMWSVDERTAKREVKRLVEAGVLMRKRAGVRGRVASYALNYSRIAETSRDSWHLVGPDFEGRMQTLAPQPKVVRLDFAPVPPLETSAGTDWDLVLKQLQHLHPAQFDSWFSGLRLNGALSTVTRITAPSPFVARYIDANLAIILLSAVQSVQPQVKRILIEG